MLIAQNAVESAITINSEEAEAKTRLQDAEGKNQKVEDLFQRLLPCCAGSCAICPLVQTYC